ncbi:MAG: hypothetical protein A3B89_02475 [Candidatus Buchananbacteria bacterium RIFCSPHIGHO2_02_FULL_40_13]|nr:MAG: hypothetical protein A3B89_02475 [Candidatus Buchananbacteria bacterium RIFCSPHIGHO2_02_FULL_40_13]
MRKEIEVKAKVANFDIVIQKLLELGCILSEPLTQNDTIFVDDNYGPFDEFQPNKNLLRIRETKWYIYPKRIKNKSDQNAPI